MNNLNLVQVFEKVHVFISQPVLFVVLGLLCVVFGLASFVLVFHWSKYAIDKSAILTAQAVYFLGGVMIIIVAFVATILY